jgi:putative transposase
VLHITAESEVAEPETPDDPIRIGFDISDSKLLTGCVYQNDTWTQPYIYDGGRARALHKDLYTTLKRLQEHGAVEWRVDERFDHFRKP